MNPLLDSDFLIQLNNDRNRTIYAHIISLNQYEHPIEQLEGVVTAGSITIDGKSAVRRTCSLTLSAKNLNINNVYWGISTKIKIEIGLQNNIIGYEDYGDIIWFKQGIFILTDFKTTQTLNNYTINLTGKDKMCLLNGDVSGNLPAPVRFDSYTDATEQSFTIGNRPELFEVGTYNNYQDDLVAEAILDGFTERYGSDYQYIRGAQKILSINYIPVGDEIAKDAMINFSNSQEENWLNLVPLLSENKTEGLNTSYTVNLDENDVYGFQVKNCNEGDQFTWVIEQKIPITIIIQEMIHQFGQERYSNIIIKDIEPYALEMLDNNFGKDYYLLHDGDIYTNLVSKEKLVGKKPENEGEERIEPEYELYESVNSYNTSEIEVNEKTGEITNFIFRNYVEEDDISLVDILANSTISQEIKEFTKIHKIGDYNKVYTVLPVLDKMVAGYGMTLLVYPDELKGEPGDSITSILDKIVNMLGNYEYFYDLNGQFVFQAKPAYLKTAWNGTIYLKDDNYVSPSELYKKVTYAFDDSLLTTQYQNTPNMNNIKNDYIIWGEKKNLSGNAIKFHGRYAIENPPLEYTDFNGYTWTSNKRQSILSALIKKKEAVINSYEHTYSYPFNCSPEESGWWEVNDWANFYSSAFGVDLSKNSTWLRYYHPNYSQEEKETGIEIFKNKYLFDYPDLNQVHFTDVITLKYENSNKENITEVYHHGSCSHCYSYFMDLRQLNEGWDYSEISDASMTSQIINTLNPERKYTLENGNIIAYGYNPDYTTSFIYRPILPTNISAFVSEQILNELYPNATNENGVQRKYALEYDVDWRELIHIMADDWYANHYKDDYEINLRKNNCWSDLDIDLFPYGRTGFEQYYLDFTSIGGCWMDIYDIYQVQYDYYNIHTDLQQKDPGTWKKLQALKTPTYDNTQITNFEIESLKEISQEKNYYNINLTIKQKYKKYLQEEISILNDYFINILWENKLLEYNKELLTFNQQLLNTKNAELEIKKQELKTINDSLNIEDLSDEIRNNLESNKAQCEASIELLEKEINDLSITITGLEAKIKEENQSEEAIINLTCSINNQIFNVTDTDTSFFINLLKTQSIEQKEWNNNLSALKIIYNIFSQKEKYFQSGVYKYWTKDVVYNPEKLPFWFEFFKADEMGIGKFAVSVIGDRPKTINDSAIKTIIYRDTPDVIYCSYVEYQYYKKRMALKDGYKYIIIGDGENYLADDIDQIENPDSLPNNIKQYFVRSIRGKTVHEQADDMLYQYSYYNDTVNINSVPIYYLQPNTIISIKDDLSKIIGYYIMDKINISLAYNGTMQITSVKAPERIY